MLAAVDGVWEPRASSRGVACLFPSLGFALLRSRFVPWPVPERSEYCKPQALSGACHWGRMGVCCGLGCGPHVAALRVVGLLLFLAEPCLGTPQVLS